MVRRAFLNLVSEKPVTVFLMLPFLSMKTRVGTPETLMDWARSRAPVA